MCQLLRRQGLICASVVLVLMFYIMHVFSLDEVCSVFNPNVCAIS